MSVSSKGISETEGCLLGSLVEKGADREDKGGGGDLKARKEEEKLTSKAQDREARKTYASRIFILVCVYLVVVFTIVLLSGLDAIAFALSDTILGIILATTTTNVLALFHFVARYLFRPPKNNR